MTQELTVRDSAVLVTGGAGFVGSNLVLRLLADGAKRVRIIDNLLSAVRENIPSHERVEFTLGSIADDEVLKSINDEFDFVFHLSTYHGNQSSIHNPLADHENNLLTTLKLCERVKDFRQLKKLVYAGAGCAVAEKTFDDPEPTTEDAPISLRMDSPYSISKLAGEFYVLYYHERHALPTVRARFQNVYGPREILGAGEWRGTPATVWRNVTPTFVYKALNHETLPLEGNGDTTRDFIYVEDLVEGLLRCALRGEPGEVYNLASGAEISIRELADRINVIAENPSPVEILPRRTWDRSGRRFGSTEKARARLGFEAKVSHEEGLRRTICWTREQRDLIDRCIAVHQHRLSA